jgi:hypothetical protein
MSARKTLIATVLAASSIASVAAEEPRPASCLIQAETSVPVKPGPGRKVYCGIDLGSRSAKLSVLSMVEGKGASIRDERLCKRTLGMGALVFDSKSRTAGPLPEAALGHLVDTVREFRKICALDGGSVVAAGATQWARDATNIRDVMARLKAETGVDVSVLSREQEAEYSYSAASLNTAGRIVLDPGSNSFELAWQERGAPVRSITVEYGYVRGAANDVEPAKDYASGMAAYQTRARGMIEEDLAKHTPPTSLAGLRTLIRRGRLSGDLIALGEDAAVVPLATRGLLRDTSSGWITEGKRYDEVLGGLPRKQHETFGAMRAAPVKPAEVRAYLRTLREADFNTLKTDPVRGLYGQKALVIPALVDLLMRELGATQLVIVPQEITTGHVLRKLAARVGLSHLEDGRVAVVEVVGRRD